MVLTAPPRFVRASLRNKSPRPSVPAWSPPFDEPYELYNNVIVIAPSHFVRTSLGKINPLPSFSPWVMPVTGWICCTNCMKENLYMAHKNFRTKPCVFKALWIAKQGRYDSDSSSALCANFAQKLYESLRPLTSCTNYILRYRYRHDSDSSTPSRFVRASLGKRLKSSRPSARREW